MIARITSFILLMAMVTGCSYRSAIPTSELKTNHSVLVIPYKGAPIYVASEVAGKLDVWVGLLAGGIAKVATADRRDEIAEYLNKESGTWDPSIVIAEECANVLSSSSKVKIISSQIAGINILPGYEDLPKENRVNFTHDDQGRAWYNMCNKFVSSDQTLLNYKKINSIVNEDWALEIFSNMFSVFNESVLGVNFYAKLSNTRTNEILSVGWSIDKVYEVPEIQKGFDFKAFDKIFRESAQKTCRTIFQDMGLIQ